MGFAWSERPFDDHAVDLAYTATPERARNARVVVQAEPRRWHSRSALSLAGVARQAGWEHPLYDGETGTGSQPCIAQGRLIYERDLLFDVFWLLTGQEERQRAKDRHGYIDLGGTPTEREGALRLALASSIGHALEQRLTDLGYRSRLPRWPHGKTAAAGIGHDVDYPEVIRWLEPLRIIQRQGIAGLRPAAEVAVGLRDHWKFAAWMEMEQHLGTRSAFYFVTRKGSLIEYATGTPDSFYDIRTPRFQRLFRRLAAEGFEIGLHASYRAYSDPAMFAAEKQALEEASGVPVVGNRHHYWHLDPQHPEETLLVHEQIGLRYDTSLVHERYLGWRRGMAWPFYPYHEGLRRAIGTLQLPTAWMDDQLFGHRAHNPGDRVDLLRTLAERNAAHGGCMLVDVHDYVFDDVLFPGWAQTYRELWEYLISRGDYWIATPRAIADFWIARSKTLTKASSGLGHHPAL